MAEHAAEPAAPAPTDAGEVRRLIDSQRPFTARAEAGERRGLYVRLGEVRAYAPASALEEAEEPDQLVGRELRFRAIAFAPDGKRVLLTTRPGWPELLRIMERDETAAARIAEVFHSGLQLEIAGVPCFLPVDRIAGFNGSALDEFAGRIGSEIDVRLIDLEVQQREAEFIASTDLEHDRAAAAEGKRALAEHRAAGRPIEAEIVQVNERGLVVSVGGAQCIRARQRLRRPRGRRGSRRPRRRAHPRRGDRLERARARGRQRTGGAGSGCAGGGLGRSRAAARQRRALRGRSREGRPRRRIRRHRRRQGVPAMEPDGRPGRGRAARRR